MITLNCFGFFYVHMNNVKVQYYVRIDVPESIISQVRQKSALFATFSIFR